MPGAQPANEVELVLRASEPGLAFHVQTAESTRTWVTMINGRAVINSRVDREFDALCQAPCEVRLTPGSYVLALSRPGAVPVPGPPLAIHGATMRVRGTYVDNARLRTAGVFTMFLGLGAAGAGVGASVHWLGSMNDEDKSIGLGFLIGSIVLVAVVSVFSGVLMAQDDGARFDD